jgi:hypothetical protein
MKIAIINTMVLIHCVISVAMDSANEDKKHAKALIKYEIARQIYEQRQAIDENIHSTTISMPNLAPESLTWAKQLREDMVKIGKASNPDHSDFEQVVKDRLIAIAGVIDDKNTKLWSTSSNFTSDQVAKLQAFNRVFVKFEYHVRSHVKSDALVRNIISSMRCGPPSAIAQEQSQNLS